MTTEQLRARKRREAEKMFQSGCPREAVLERFGDFQGLDELSKKYRASRDNWLPAGLPA